MTRAGLRKFLLLVSTTVLLDIDSIPEWDRLYRMNAWASKATRELRIRIPSALSDSDRARARWLIQKDNANPPPHVRRWTRRTQSWDL